MLKVSKLLQAALVGAAIFKAVPSSAAVPAPGSDAIEASAKVAVFPFEPPLGQKLRYRSTKTIEKDGKSQMQWSVADYRFDKADDGYRLTIIPVDNGSGSSDPTMRAIEKKLAGLMAQPCVLIVSQDAVITGFENADLYWNAVFNAVEAGLAEAGKSGNLLPPQFQAALAAYLKSMREMPAEARLALLTETVQPLVQFAATEWSSEEPVVSQIETASPFGGQLKHDVRIALDGIDGDTAMMTLHSTIPREELERLTQTALAPFAAALPPKDAGKLSEGMRTLNSFTHETRASYSVSVVDGLVQTHRSTETIEAGADAGTHRRVTTVSFDRVE